MSKEEALNKFDEEYGADESNAQDFIELNARILKIRTALFLGHNRR